MTYLFYFMVLVWIGILVANIWQMFDLIKKLRVNKDILPLRLKVIAWSVVFLGACLDVWIIQTVFTVIF